MAHGLSSVMSGMDNVRNITGSPIAGIDPHELINVRQLCHGEHSYTFGLLTICPASQLSMLLTGAVLADHSYVDGQRDVLRAPVWRSRHP